jgi:UDP-N-acetyl-D-mannosaminuronic acid dehydrogenase
MARILCVGVGHVGLPLSLKLWAAGHAVVPLDVDIAKIEGLRMGTMPFEEDGCDRLLAQAAGDARFVPITYEDARFTEWVGSAEYVVMTLGTPLGGDHTFRFDQYFDVLDRITPYLRRGVTLVVRSTVAPRFTRNVVATRVGSQRDWVPGVDFFPSFCPERLLQGNALRDIDTLPEIIGADDSETAARAEALFRSLAPDKQCLHLTTIEAELAKLFLNTFRYTLFGLANEFAMCAEQYGADMYAVLEAANSGYLRGGIPRPGPSRGPCLGKDTAALAYSSMSSFIAHAALKTHDNLLLRVVDDLRAALGSFAHRRICVLGLAFKPETDDIRDNLTSPLVDLLVREGATVAIYDPLVAGYDDPGALLQSDALVLMTAHAELTRWTEGDLIALCGRRRDQIFVYDLWNVWPWADRILGRGAQVHHEDSGYRGMRLAHAGSHPPAP